MKLVSLYADNFKKLKFESPLRFGDGITVISGLNEAGKSTVLDAILYALFARVTRPPGHAKNEDLVGYQANRCVVSLEFAIGGELYRVRREIRKTRTEYQTESNIEMRMGEDHWKPVGVKSREVTNTVESLLGGISFDEMLSSNVVAQKDLGRLVDPKSNRWKVVNAFLHLESFTEVVDALNDEKKDLEGTGPSRPGTINTAKEKLTQLTQVNVEYSKRLQQNSNLEEEDAKLTKADENLASEYRELEALQAKLSEYDEVLQKKQQFTNQADSKQELLEKHKLSVSAIEPKVEKAQAELASFTGLPSDEQIARVSDLRKNVDTDEGRLAQINDLVSAKEKEVSRLEEELQPYDKDDIKKASITSKSLKPYLGGLAVASIAAAVSYLLSVPLVPWFLAAVAVLFAVLLARRVNEMSKLVKLEGLVAKLNLWEKQKKEVEVLRTRISEIQNSKTANEGSLLVAMNDISYYGSLGEGLNPLSRASLLLQQYVKDVENSKSAARNLDVLKDSLAELRGQVDESEITKQLVDLRSNADTLSFPSLPNGISFSKQLLAEASRKKEETANKVSSNVSTIEANKRVIDENVRFLEDNRGIEDEVASQTRLIGRLQHQLLVTLLAKEGVEATVEAIKARIRPGVARHMGEILPKVTLGRYKAVLLNDDFGVEVFDPEAGEYRPRDVFSGGTDDQFLLAMRIAFALSLVPEAKGTRPEFLWLDEPLGSSDEFRRSGIIDYLSTSLSKSFNQIFIVSHVGGLEESVRNVVRLDNGKVS